MMNQEDIFKKIGLILDELQDQYAYLSQNPKQFNELELELFMANANFLSDHVQIVQKLNNSKTQQLPLGSTHVVVTPPVPPVTTLEATVQETLPFDAVPLQTSGHQESVIPLVVNEEVFPEVNFGQELTNQPEIFPEDQAALKTVSDPQQETEAPVETATAPEVSAIDKEVFKLDKEPSTFEFILKDIGESDRFEFEEKSVDDIFDRPLSKEEEQIIAQKQKLRQEQLHQVKEREDDEIGPEPFLVEKEEEIVPVATTQLQVDDPEKKEVIYQKEIPAAYKSPETKTEEATKKPTLNELLASQRGLQNVNSDNSRHAITDLKQGISLNDKMLYIKDLFNGYNLAYAEVIDLINKMPDFKTVDAFLQNNYAEKNNWAARKATVDKFYELLNKRFQVK